MRRLLDPARPAIPVRRWRFGFSPERSRRWVGGSVVTLFAHAMSPLFPAGERFFIRSVLAFRDQITDPALLAEIRQFVAQEGVHTAQHVQYDASVQPHYDLAGLERDTERILEVVGDVLRVLDGRVLNKKRMDLAATVGLEHFTALLGEQLLKNQDAFAGADPEYQRLWLWHAVEEIEHKAVAFDVFEAIGGTYGERIAAFAIATVMIYAVMVRNVLRMLERDGELMSPEAWRALLHWGLVHPGLFRKAVPGYVDYLRRDFHPWQNDNRDLIAAFKARFESATAA